MTHPRGTKAPDDGRDLVGPAGDGRRPAGGSAAPLEGVTSSVYLPPFRIDITVRPGVRPNVSRHRIAAAVRSALEAAGAPGPASIAVVLSDDSELAELNTTHMGASGPTDVLSFPFFPPEAFPPHERGVVLTRDPWVAAALKQAFALPPGLRAHLGDIIVSVERAAVQAAQGRGGQTSSVAWTAAEEMLLLSVHGTRRRRCGRSRCGSWRPPPVTRPRPRMQKLSGQPPKRPLGIWRAARDSRPGTRSATPECGAGDIGPQGPAEGLLAAG
jgi:ssRNA-specific RNase YbeY (16S rRNA maturation enzyme)